MEWRLTEWNQYFAAKVGVTATKMPREEIDKAIGQLRDSNYPKPQDCPEGDCPDFRPACTLGVCKVAVAMCGDF